MECYIPELRVTERHNKSPPLMLLGQSREEQKPETYNVDSNNVHNYDECMEIAVPHFCYAEIKQESDPHLYAFGFFLKFFVTFPVHVSSFLILFPAVIDLLLDFKHKIFRESNIKMGKFYHGLAMPSHRQFCSEFFTQISGHFCGYFRLN